ncbi:MAG: hypothetical protein KatS3mg026_1543 [Bacteroidia bacterium]|nr:MAG: hypothetical protein KatS3mg026_1543 [Bacteroidia bacterium]
MSLWKKNGHVAAPAEKTLCLLGEGSQTKGEFYTPGSLRVEGTFKGTLRVEGRLVIAPTGEVQGEIQAAQVLVAGRFEGRLVAEELLEVAETGHIKGEIRARRMQTASGATMQVHCWVGENLAEPAPTPENDHRTARPRRG